jgi:hypothetical protein
MALPTTGISTNLVGTTLGVSTRNVGNLCRAASINKWSRYKPIISNKVIPLEELDFHGAKYGMSIPFFSTAADLVTYYRGLPTEVWSYVRPTGGASSPFRIGDFRGYGHEANKFYNTQNVPAQVFGTGDVQTGIGANNMTAPYNMNWTILDFANSYFGALAVRSGTNTGHVIVTSDTTMGTSAGQSIMIPTSGMSGGNSYDCYAFVADKSTVSPYPITRFHAIENGYLGTFTIYGSRINITIDASKILDVDSYTVNYTVTLQNISLDAPVTLNSCSVQVRYADREQTDPLIFGEQQQSLGNITIQPNSTETRSGTFLMVLGDYSAHGGGYVAFYNTSEPTLTGRDYV